MPERRAVIAGAALAVAAALVPVIEPHRLLARELPQLKLETDIPARFGHWRIDESIIPVLPSPDVQEQLDHVYSQQLSRTYVDDAGNRIMLVIAYGENQVDKTTVAHLPDACYPAQGFTVEPRAPRPVDLGGRPLDVTRLVANRAGRNEPVTFWTTVGNTTFSSDRERRMTRLWSSLNGVIPDGMLVRVSSIDAQDARAFSVQDNFVQSLYLAATESVRPRIFGR